MRRTRFFLMAVTAVMAMASSAMAQNYSGYLAPPRAGDRTADTGGTGDHASMMKRTDRSTAGDTRVR